jgi:hypothetical protein
MDSIRRLCSIEDCQGKYKAKGYCPYHYVRLAKPQYIRKKKHKVPSPEYRSYAAMKTRVTNPNSQDYVNYGGRGIKICKRWSESFAAFHSDLGDKPGVTYTLDRKDFDGNYSCGKCDECRANNWPMNCRWATPSQQVWNRRKKLGTKSIYIGVTKNGNLWSAHIGYTTDNSHMSQYLGTYKTQEEAAIAYDVACIFFRGSEAKTNIL